MLLYLNNSKAGLKVLVLERRHIVGGAAVTEEIIPGFKFSRASYLAGISNPIIKEYLIIIFEKLYFDIIIIK